MSDDKQEQPAEGGSYTRQPDGSLLRNPPEGAGETSPPAAKTTKKGK